MTTNASPPPDQGSGESRANDPSRPLRWAGFLLWAALMACSLFFAATTAKAGDGFTRGLNRIVVFGQWQLAAFVVAVACAVHGRRSAPLPAASRILAYLPLATQVAEVLALVALVVIARLGNS